MTRFIDLPDELILEISSHLDVEDLSLACKPFHQWTSRLLCHTNSTSLRNQSVAALASTNKRFYSLLISTLYYHPAISGVPKTPLSALKKIPITTPNLGKHILSAHITISNKPTFKTCMPIFFLPAITSLSITTTATWNEEYFAPVWLPSLYGMSTLQKLHLVSFPGLKQDLREIFSWPRSLKKLWLEIDQRWADYHGNSSYTYSGARFFNALAPLQPSLERLVLTRRNPKIDMEDEEQVGLIQGYPDAINFRVLEKLKDLRTYEVFLVGNGKPPVWSNMPPNLETLEVFYDDSSHIPFLCGEDASNYSWLLHILSCKPNMCRKLGRIQVISPEKTPDQWLEVEGLPDDRDDDDREAMERELRRLREEGLKVATVLKEAFEQAGVSYSLYLNKYFKVKHFVFGGTEFEEDWDEGEITQ